MNSNSNDTIMPAILVWGFWLSTSAVARGATIALAGWTKFASLLLAPLWLTYPNGLRPRTAAKFAIGFVVATLAVFSILLFEPSLTTAVHSFVNRTLGYQLDRDSPFSPWDWGQYHASGIPNLHVVQVILQVGVLALAGVVAAIPLRKGPLELAALSAAVLVGFELTLTHWSYLYIPWFLPFVLLALLLPRREPDPSASRARARARGGAVGGAAGAAVTHPDRVPRAGRGGGRPRRRPLRRAARGRPGDLATRPSTAPTASGSRAATCRTATSCVEYPPGALVPFVVPALVTLVAGTATTRRSRR